MISVNQIAFFGVLLMEVGLECTIATSFLAVHDQCESDCILGRFGVLLMEVGLACTIAHGTLDVTGVYSHQGSFDESSLWL